MTELFIGSDGDLYDTSRHEWYLKRPLRKNYKFTHRLVTSVADFKATLRNGGYTWPGGYPIGFVTDDGGFLCFDCARENARDIMAAIRHNSRDGWRVVNVEIAEEDNCSHCGKEF